MPSLSTRIGFVALLLAVGTVFWLAQRSATPEPPRLPRPTPPPNPRPPKGTEVTLTLGGDNLRPSEGTSLLRAPSAGYHPLENTSAGYHPLENTSAGYHPLLSPPPTAEGPCVFSGEQGVITSGRSGFSGEASAGGMLEVTWP